MDNKDNLKKSEEVQVNSDAKVNSEDSLGIERKDGIKRPKNNQQFKDEIKVKFENKSSIAKIVINSLLSWTISIYILGAFVVISGYATTFVYQTVVARILEFIFSYELSTFMKVVTNPIIIAVTILLVIPALLLFWALKYTVVKLGVFHTDFEEKAFVLISFVMLLLSVSVYF